MTKNSLFLGLCGLLEAAVCLIYLGMASAAGPLTFHSWNATVVLLGKLAIAAALCAIAAAGFTRTIVRAWPLVLNGLALAVLGAIQYRFVRFPIRLRTIALLVILIAVSLAVLLLRVARAQRGFSRMAGAVAAVVSAGFVLPFLALGYRWIGLQPGSHIDLLWLGAYFGFSALCMLALALRAPGQALAWPALYSSRTRS